MRIYYLDTSQSLNIDNLWSRYTSIKDSSVVVVANEDKLLSQSSALAIFYAMKLKLPIIFYNIPEFKPGIFPFLKEVILKRLNKLVVANINILDVKDAEILLASSASVNYTLTRRETALGYSYTLSQLRDALTKAKASDLSPYPELATLSPLQP